jgi:hypothetical protein
MYGHLLAWEADIGNHLTRSEGEALKATRCIPSKLVGTNNENPDWSAKF